MILGLGMGAAWIVLYASYALGFWYGAKLVRDEPQNYTPGRLLVVSVGWRFVFFKELTCLVYVLLGIDCMHLELNWKIIVKVYIENVMYFIY